MTDWWTLIQADEWEKYRMTDKGLLHSTWHLGAEFAASFYTGSALTPTEQELTREQYLTICQKYIPYIDYESYVDDGNYVVFYDVQAQLDDAAAEADREERRALEETQFYASYRGQ